MQFHQSSRKVTAFLNVACPPHYVGCEPQIIYWHQGRPSVSVRVWEAQFTQQTLLVIFWESSSTSCVGIQARRVSWKLRTHKPASITTAYLLSHPPLITRHWNNTITHARHVPKETHSSIFNHPQRQRWPQWKESLLKFAPWARVSYSRVLF